MSDILILGSAGFVGSNLTNYLIQHTKYTVASVDWLEAGVDELKKLAPAMGAKSRHTFYLANITDVPIMRRILEIETPKIIIYNIVDRKKSRDWWKVARDLELWCKAAQHFLNPTTEKILFLMDTYSDWWEWVEDIAEQMLPNVYNRWHIVARSELFGPRQQDITGVSGATWGYLDSDQNHEPYYNDQDLKSWMYIRDYFFTLLKLVESDHLNGKYYIGNDQLATEHQVQSWVRHLIKGEKAPDPEGWVKRWCGWPENYTPLFPAINTDLPKAIEHTVAWYDSNRWIFL
jgi:nucleoside-diphosphate-sugar epimerase